MTMNTIENRISRRRAVRRRTVCQRTGRRALRRMKGMTLIEIMIVVIIMAVIATAAGVALYPQLERANIDATRTDSHTVAGAVELYMAQNQGECPTMQDLIDGRVMNRSQRTTDAWEHDFSIECTDEGVLVVSAGPDGQMGNEDDVRSDQTGND
jgi:general secretion pathway protein G